MSPVTERDPDRPAAKVMFEIYREGGYDRRFRVIYFTELNEHNRDHELNRCLAGESLYSGFLREEARAEARRVIASLLRRLNDGEEVLPDQVEGELRLHLA
ncbi:MAG: hypothetical protein ACLGG9_01485 [Thermoleophilia bacterium]